MSLNTEVIPLTETGIKSGDESIFIKESGGIFTGIHLRRFYEKQYYQRGNFQLHHSWRRSTSRRRGIGVAHCIFQSFWERMACCELHNLWRHPYNVVFLLYTLSQLSEGPG